MGREESTVRRSVLRSRLKAKKLLQLYSLWQETRRMEVQEKCMGLLGEILDADPKFNPRREFQNAF